VIGAAVAVQKTESSCSLPSESHRDQKNDRNCSPALDLDRTAVVLRPDGSWITAYPEVEPCEQPAVGCRPDCSEDTSSFNKIYCLVLAGRQESPFIRLRR